MSDNNPSQFIIYQSEDGQIKLDVRFVDETVWLTQALMAELFQTSSDNISLHLKNIYPEGELSEKATTEDFSVVRQEGARQVNRRLRHYNLDAIISVGYRVQSHTATRFRQWATQHLREYIVNAEIIHSRADSDKANMGLTNWRGAKVRKQDVVNAKNYLNAEELQALNNLVEQYLVFAEGQAMRRIPMSMRDWLAKLDGFLTLNDRDILEHAGKVSHQMARQLAEQEYDKFHQLRLQQEASQTDQYLEQLSEIVDKRIRAENKNKGKQKP